MRRDFYGTDDYLTLVDFLLACETRRREEVWKACSQVDPASVAALRSKGLSWLQVCRRLKLSTHLPLYPACGLAGEHRRATRHTTVVAS